MTKGMPTPDGLSLPSSAQDRCGYLRDWREEVLTCGVNSAPVTDEEFIRAKESLLAAKSIFEKDGLVWEVGERRGAWNPDWKKKYTVDEADMERMLNGFRDVMAKGNSR